MKRALIAAFIGTLAPLLLAAEPAAPAREDLLASPDAWEILDPDTWRWNEDGTLEITARRSDYKPPHRSPGHVALLKEVYVGDFDLSLRVRSTKDTGAHRDCCVFFGWQNPAQFYYVHLGARPDPHSGQIMIVNEGDRVALTENDRPVPWDDKWHTIRLKREVDTGLIAVYFDDLEEPLMEITDKTFKSGRIGIGSFDDMNAFDDVRLAEPVGDE